MTTPHQEHGFDLAIARSITDDEVDALFAAGCDDCTPEVSASRTVLHFDRVAAALSDAIASAVVDVEAAGLVVDGVGAPDLVDVPEIAARVGRTRESVRLLAAGKRGPGGFPTAEGGFYSWANVRAWFAAYDPDAVGAPGAADLEYDRVIAAAAHVVRARALMHRHAQGLSALLPA